MTTPLAQRIADAYIKFADLGFTVLREESDHITEDLERVSQGGVTFGPFTVTPWEITSIRPIRTSWGHGAVATWNQHVFATHSAVRAVVRVVCRVHQHPESKGDPMYQVKWEVNRHQWDDTVDIREGLQPEPAILRVVAHVCEQTKQTFMARYR